MTNPTTTAHPRERSATTYERRDSAAWIRLTRPEQRNAINPDVLEGIESGLERARGDGARSVVITGAGGVFCAGADLKLVMTRLEDLSGVAALLERASTLTTRIESHPAPVIAAVNGPAIAGGFELVLACDLVIAAAGATLSDGHANYGLFPGAGSSARLPRRIGATRAKHFLFTGRAASAEEMRDLGVVNEVVPPEELESAVDALCAQLAERGRGGLALMKRVVLEGEDAPLDVALALEQRAAREHLRSAEVREGLSAFAERRRPRFGGNG